MCWAKIKAFFKEKPARVVNIAAEIAERFINTKRGGPNMPKKQPCPHCKGWVPRFEKTEDGAIYSCTRCKLKFLVKRPLIKRREKPRGKSKKRF